MFGSVDRLKRSSNQCLQVDNTVSKVYTKTGGHVVRDNVNTRHIFDHVMVEYVAYI